MRAFDGLHTPSPPTTLMEFSSRKAVLYPNELRDQHRLRGVLYRFELYFDTVEVVGSNPPSPSSFSFSYQRVGCWQGVALSALVPEAWVISPKLVEYCTMAVTSA
jgi:hypothetical protein